MMLGIIERYVALELIKSSVAMTLILFVIFMSNTLGRVLSDVSEGKVPLDAVFPVMAGQSIKIFTFLLPLGFFLGVIFAFGRLYKDHELVVLHACGYTYGKLYRVVVMLLIPLLGLLIWLSLWQSADMLRSAREAINADKDVHEIQRLKPGHFNPSEKGDRVFFVQSLNDAKTQINEVVIAELKERSSLLQTAQQGQHDINDETGDLFLEVGPGTRYEGVPGQQDYRVVDYETHGILLEKKAAKAAALKSEEKSLSELMQSTSIRDRVELVWRFNLPLVLVVLALLAVPLSYISPRQGRYGKIGVSLLLFIVYLNLIGLSKSALESGKMPMWLNFWWVHLVFLMLTIMLIRKRLGHLLPLREVKR